MATKNGWKEDAFRLWAQGATLSEIRQKSPAKENSLTQWVMEWERGSQRAWEPQIRRS